MEVFLKCLARFRAIALFPEPQTPLMKMILLPSLIASRISLTMSAWVFPFEKVRGGSSSLELLNKFAPSPESSSVFLYNDHILCLFRIRNRGDGLKALL